MVSIRYMGTKRVLGPIVRDAIATCNDHGRVADVFSGMGAIASHLTTDCSVFLSDVLTFPTVFARAHCLEEMLHSPRTLLSRVFPLFRQHRSRLRSEFADRISNETVAIEGGPDPLHEWMLSAPHVGTSRAYKNMAIFSKKTSSYRRYCLTTLYFSSGYFSTAQAIDLDSLRYALDKLGLPRSSTAPLFAIWLATASRIINSPGHSAQYLKPTNRSSYRTLRRQLSRNVWEVFVELTHDFHPWGSRTWRLGNSVVQEDALEIVAGLLPSDIGVIYADPPYTKDQYSRFYHLFETLYLYDFPMSTGIGRYRDNRYASPFSKKTEVIGAFERLFSGVRDLGIPLVLSYPSDGMLNVAGASVEEFVRDNFSDVSVISISNTHSTMGASKGPARKNTIEHIFVCK